MYQESSPFVKQSPNVFPPNREACVRDASGDLDSRWKIVKARAEILSEYNEQHAEEGKFSFGIFVLPSGEVVQINNEYDKRYEQDGYQVFRVGRDHDEDGRLSVQTEDLIFPPEEQRNHFFQTGSSALSAQIQIETKQYSYSIFGDKGGNYVVSCLNHKTNKTEVGYPYEELAKYRECRVELARSAITSMELVRLPNGNR